MPAARIIYSAKCPENEISKIVKVFGMKRSGIYHIDAIGNWVFQVTVGYRYGLFQGGLRA
jgi:hypothetical protein